MIGLMMPLHHGAALSLVPHYGVALSSFMTLSGHATLDFVDVVDPQFNDDHL